MDSTDSEPPTDTPSASAGSHSAQSIREVVETVVGSAIWSLIWAMILNATLNLFHSNGDIKHLIGYSLRGELPGFLIGSGVVWLVVLLVLCASGRLWLTCALTLSAVVGLGLVDQTKMRVRLEPLYPSDLDFLRSPGFLISMVSPGQILLAMLAMSIGGATVLLIGRVPQRTFRPIRRSATPSWWRNLLAARIGVILICLFSLHYAMSFNSVDNKLRHAFESSGTKWAFWYQDINYKRNGVVAGMLYNLLGEPMSPPEGYSEKTMAEIAERWQAVAAQVNTARSGDLSDVNVITVLSEAFSDPTTVAGTDVTGDPIPFTRNLMSETTSGTLLTQLYGGGTANMEFETLTGQSISIFEPQVNTPYQQFVHTQPSYSTIAGYLKAQGHRPIAIHPYITAMYQRKPVYKVFGFEDFIHDTDLQDPTKIDDAQFISDESAFDEVIRQIDRTDEPVFVNLVTMQNHLPTSDVYRDPWPATASDDETERALAGYARGINHSDRALSRLVSRLSASKEKTAIVFYGDHRPGIYPGAVIDKNTEINMKSTPFFIWTNFETAPIKTAAMTSPIYLMPLLFEQVDADIPPFYALLAEMYRKIPAMEQEIQLDWEGLPLESLDPQAAALLKDFRLIQYDLSVGERFAADTLFYPLRETDR